MINAIQTTGLCPAQADYSIVPAARRLPFQFALDASSLLYPPAGQNQRFVYTIAGVGEDTSEYADLSHFLFAVCGDITEDMLRNVSVVIDGVPQDVVIGENVEILTAENPDNRTGCAGLKFDFGLGKVGGEMTVSYELAEPYAVGPVLLCVSGGQTALNSLAICGPVCGNAETPCPVTGLSRARVCVPVTVTPYAELGAPSVYCCGSPSFVGGVSVCPGVVRGSCSFTVTQDVCIAVPMVFGATAAVGDYSVECLTDGDS